MNIEILRVDHFGETPEENKRVTLAPATICGVFADQQDVTVQGRQLRNVIVCLEQGGEMRLTINHVDLEMLERCVGGYIRPEDMF